MTVLSAFFAKIAAHKNVQKNQTGSLVSSLIRLSSVWFIVALMVTGLGLTALFQASALRRFEVSIAQIADNLYADTDIAPDGSLLTPDFFDTRVTRVYSGLYWQVSEINEGQAPRPLSRSRSLWDREIGISPKALMDAQKEVGAAVFYDTKGPNGAKVRVALIYSMIGQRAFAFLVAEDRSAMDKDVTRFAFITLGALVLMSLGALTAIFWQVKVGLKPLFALTDEITDIRHGKAQKIVQSYPKEITPVADQINALIDYAQDTVERQRTHVGNLAHALKTPLSVLLGAAKDNEPNLGVTVDRQVALMKAQVDHHLRRARAAARLQGFGESTEVEEVIDEMAVMMEQVFRDKGVIIDWRGEDGLMFQGEKQDFQEIVGNLLENACKWCAKKVRLDLRSLPDQNRFEMRIEDDGKGLSEDRFDEVLLRGARLDETTPGTGLGLSIVDELVRAYGGQLRLEKASLGGLGVCVVLPKP